MSESNQNEQALALVDPDQVPVSESTGLEVKVVEVELMPKDFRLYVGDGTGTGSFGFSLTPDGVELDENQTPAQFRAGLVFFKYAQDRIKISFSEYVRKGKLKHGLETVEAGLQQLEFDMPTVKAAVDIASVPLELRNAFLTADHYVVLARADLTPKQRVKWAKVATEQRLTPAQLKASIAAGEVVPKATADKNTHGIINIHGLRGEYDIWFRRVGGVEGIRAMNVKCQQEIIDELSVIAQLFTQLTSAPLEQVPLPKQPKATKVKKPAKKTKRAKK